MTHLTANGQAWVVIFQHEHPEPLGVLDLEGHWRRGRTRCLIRPAQAEDAAAEGIAYCSFSDPYRRVAGRKVALTKALQSFPKSWRAAFWEAYLTQRGGRP